ncbi:ShlB/FhaC/HecB family hemolysin secretion/activation protein [Polynucleobacter sp. MWH-Loch1C5]|uniref:ShlB/FhaC/HecB family hemolysin secretion/activation protein n=1 Tax=Polynucleobacter sp. MWH-Loch1C5 TaxID=2689108 RepID=UPI001C0B3818|nr:ShlB/FhaC/HecB family hemolysin secretion/activation protein [Polynucleobacter sp. MWH-Loch1C5]
MSALAQQNQTPPAGPSAGALLQELQRQVPAPQALPAPQAPKLAPKPQEAKPSEARVTVQGFKVDGNQSLGDLVIQETLRPWIGKTIPFEELQKAADALASLYKVNNRLAQVSVPPQRIADGVVTLKVLEARLGVVHVDLPNGPSRFGEERARRYLTDANRPSEIINTQAVERSIYVLNETPGIAVASQLEQGKNEGEVDIRLSLSDTKPFRGRLEANNNGSRSTGILQRVAAVFFDGIGGIGDQLSLSNIKSEGSDYSLASYSLPLNTDGLRAGVSASYLDYENVGKYAFPVNQGGGFGRAQTIGVNLTYPLLRSPGANSNLTAGLDRKNYLNKQQRDGSHTSEYRIDNMVLGYSANRYDSFAGGGVTQGGITLTKGHLIFGAENPSTYGRYTPTTFTKVNFNLSRSQQVVPDATVLNINLSAQIASVDLDSAEKFYLGGPNGVRGYPGSQGAGSQGAMINLELQQALEDKVVASFFYDAGFVEQYREKYAFEQMKGRTGADNTYSLSSVGAGLKRADKDIVWSTSIAWKLGRNPLLDNMGNGVNNDGRSKSAYIWAQVQWIF